MTSINYEAFRNCSSLTSINIPNSVTSIGDSAFSGCNGLTSITIPNSVTSIGSYAFYGCTSLTSITIPNSVTSIGGGAFSGCSGLEKVIVPDIAAWCGISFYNSSANPLSVVHHLYSDEETEIIDLVIPNSVTSIGGCAFSGCSGLTSVTIPNSVTSIGYEAFEKCSSLTSVTIPNSVTSIGVWAFIGCSGLTSVTIPNSVTSIGEYTFNGCSSLTSITIGSGVKSIGYSAFYGCTSLTDVYCYAENVPNTSSDAFYNSPIASATLHVSTSSVEAYRTTEPWSGFGKILPLPLFYTLTYMVDGDVYKTYEIEEGTAITPEPAPAKEGYTFSGWSEIPETMPDHDVTVTGSFIQNYTLTYIVDGKVYKTYSVAFGSSITPEEAPTKEGYTFSGWSYIPPTMPASDVVVMGSFIVNSYTLTYMVDGEKYKSYELELLLSAKHKHPMPNLFIISGWAFY